MQVNVAKDGAWEELRSSLPNPKECVYVCIGTQKVLSDSLGPVVGSLLQERMTEPIFVYGLEESNINALNLLASYNLIKLMHSNKKIVVIDSAVGDVNEVGSVQTFEGSLIPGAATNKNLPHIGDYSIMGVISLRGLKDFYVTTCDRLELVKKLAETIVRAIVGQ